MTENKNKEDKFLDPIDNSLDSTNNFVQDFMHTDEKSICNTNKKEEQKEEHKSPLSNKDGYVDIRYFLINF
jgi:hypothetical protein